MQQRHLDRQRYFHELSKTSEKFILPYLNEFITIKRGIHILEIGCGEGGNLLPFASKGCKVTGIDISSNRINQAKYFFRLNKVLNAEFICNDVFKYNFGDEKFDIIICHDVYEHIHDKIKLIRTIEQLLKPHGKAFIAFPPWQMPFGGHQQICHNRFISSCPFIHLLPHKIYTSILKAIGEPDYCINELIAIKRTRTNIENFRNVIQNSKLTILNHIYWFINPHYEQKFNLKHRKLWSFLSNLPYFRNYLTTSFWCIVSIRNAHEPKFSGNSGRRL